MRQSDFRRNDVFKKARISRSSPLICMVNYFPILNDINDGLLLVCCWLLLQSIWIWDMKHTRGNNRYTRSPAIYVNVLSTQKVFCKGSIFKCLNCISGLFVLVCPALFMYAWKNCECLSKQSLGEQNYLQCSTP